VLVVEDEAVVARDLERSLGDMGYDVIAAVTSGEEALRASSRRVPDVVLMDIRIAGDKDGIATASLLKARYQVPVIYMTAYADAETVARAAQSGPYGYIVKPFTSREVRSAIEIACRKHDADQQVTRRERWFATMLRSIGDAVIACDCERRVEFMNPKAEQLTGWRLGDASGRTIDEVVKLFRGDGPGLEVIVQQALDQRRTEHEPPSSSQLIARDGASVHSVEDSASAIVHEGELLGAVVVLRDVTHQRQVQERAIVAERLASLGTLAAGIAHEVNNPLTFVIGNAYCIERMLQRWEGLLSANGEAGELDNAREFVADLRTGAERIQRIVADMGVFGTSSVDPPALVDVRASVEWALRVTANAIRHRAQLSVELSEVPPVVARESELGQVFVNLLVNASQAIPEGEAPMHSIRVASRVDEHGGAMVSVRNTGAVIPAAVLSRVFEPFFSTKPPGQGTGLGLTICRRIVASLGGELKVESSKEHGTCFEVHLPKAALTRSGRPLVETNEEEQHGRVLVIDDDPAVLRLLNQLVGRKHEVVAVDSATEGMRLLEEDHNFDLVLCDLMMPGMGGEELLRRVERRWPRVAASMVFMTGGAYTPAAAAFLASITNPRIQKPFQPIALMSLLQRGLRERKARESGNGHGNNGSQHA
ncbi:MAG TPA: response regulator, partial [Polyangiales bacterium]|nr:response regulator [Polyangiales bacterium]